MTENEALEILKTHNDKCSGCDKLCDDLCKPAVETAINALLEIQQYRAIGTVDEIESINFSSNQLRLVNLVEEYKEKLKEYEKIGTVEECREARERQRAKKPLVKSKKKGKIQIGDYVYVKCPCCKEEIFSCFHYPPWNEPQKKHKYCENCGQAIDWNDTD